MKMHGISRIAIGAATLLGTVTTLRAAEPACVFVDRPVGVESGGRHGEFHKKFLAGPHAVTRVATYFGGPGAEEFVAAAALADARLVAFGNAWGPQFPAAPAVSVWGKGGHSGQPAYRKDKNGRDIVNLDSPDRSGMVVFFDRDARRIERAARFDWGVASIEAGCARARGKSLVIAGRCGPHFASFLESVRVRQAVSCESTRKGAAANAGDAYLAGLTADGAPEWVVVLQKAGRAPETLFADDAGRLWFDANGLRRVDADGGNVALFNSRSGSGTTRWLGVQPDGAAAWFGGDRNTHTGAEPYRQPFLYKFGENDRKLYTLWEPEPKAIGAKGDGSNLMSDSSPRAMAVAHGGKLLVTGWSDGGNTVFARQALDYRQPASSLGLGMSAWGMKNANSLCHLMVIDDRMQHTDAYSSWLCYIPDWFENPSNRGAPNGVGIQSVLLTEKSRLVAFTGGAATGLIQTPGCYWRDPKDGAKYGGRYVTILRADMTSAVFSSYLPGYEDAGLASRDGDVIVVGRSAGQDFRAAHPTATPVTNAVQAVFGGGTDGHLILLKTPVFAEAAK